MKTKGIFLILTVILATSQIGCKKDSIKSDKCNLEPDPGNCFAHIPKYYFDKEEGKCKEFIWGGCNGTVPFDTLEECEEFECND